MHTDTGIDGGKPQVPPQALLLSLLSLWVPVLSSSLFPSWSSDEAGILIWLLALIPPFLLSYYRGWRGASVALAGGMAAYAVSQVGVILAGAPVPPPETMLIINVVLIVVSLGVGVISTLFHRSLSRAERMSLTDPGTGLPNRRHGMMHLQRAFAAAQRGADLAVALFDLDRFKQVNDRYGHRAGDEVLRVFAGILLRHTRAMHIAARFGGEEFLAVFDNSTAGGASVMVERVLEAMRRHDFGWGRVTASAGLSEYEPGMASPDVLVAAADQALYRSKAAGRDRFTILSRKGAAPAGDASVPVPASAQDIPDGNGELILVVDDDPAVLRTLTRGLRRRRYHPLSASDPMKALEIARGLAEPIDLVVTDVVMPGMSGFRLVEMLMEVQPSLRSLYISGYSREEVRWSGVPGAVKAFLAKPLSLDELAVAVRSCLDQPVEAPAAAAVAGLNGGRPEDEAERQLRDQLAASAARFEDAQSEILVRLALAADHRDDLTGRHAQRVARLCGLLAHKLGLGEEEVARIEQASLLHDLGKIGVPDSILNKPEALTPTEEQIMQRHCEIGACMLAGSRHPLLQEAERVARSHHERWDGGGYPDGRAGVSIPVSARITAVADAYDSLSHARPYRPAVSGAEALRIVAADAGRQFDPRVVRALQELAEAGILRELEQDELAGEWLGAPPPRAAAC